MARQFWPGEEAVGKRFYVDEVSESRAIEVVGVAADGKYRSLNERPRFFVYVPLAQRYMPAMSLLARTDGGANPVAEVRRLLAKWDPNLPAIDAQPLPEYIGMSLMHQRVAGFLAGALGIVGLALAAVGIYGITAQSASQRTRELGIRMALGARRADVLRLILWQGLRLASAGGILGIAAALALTRLIENLLFGVSPTDPAAIAGTSGLLIGVSLLASYVPARRASRIDPVSAIRYE
jgi:ABC-type antimicrobial peptide transport system permease subunit